MVATWFWRWRNRRPRTSISPVLSRSAEVECVNALQSTSSLNSFWPCSTATRLALRTATSTLATCWSKAELAGPCSLISAQLLQTFTKISTGAVKVSYNCSSQQPSTLQVCCLYTWSLFSSMFLLPHDQWTMGIIAVSWQPPNTQAHKPAALFFQQCYWCESACELSQARAKLGMHLHLLYPICSFWHFLTTGWNTHGATILLKLAVAIFKTVVGSKVVHWSDFFGVFVAGKKEYSPPEMISVDHYKAVATDVWMLGMSLFQMLQGYLPFVSDLEILKKDVQFDRKVSEGESVQHFSGDLFVYFVVVVPLLQGRLIFLASFEQ